jgi:hypothetical protein
MESTKEGLFTNTQNTNLDFIKLEDVVSILKNIKAQENRDIIFVIFFRICYTYFIIALLKSYLSHQLLNKM